jgi:hypothetical protein
MFIEPLPCAKLCVKCFTGVISLDFHNHPYTECDDDPILQMKEASSLVSGVYSYVLLTPLSHSRSQENLLPKKAKVGLLFHLAISLGFL